MISLKSRIGVGFAAVIVMALVLAASADNDTNDLADVKLYDAARLNRICLKYRQVQYASMSNDVPALLRFMRDPEPCIRHRAGWDLNDGIEGAWIYGILHGWFNGWGKKEDIDRQVALLEAYVSTNAGAIKFKNTNFSHKDMQEVNADTTDSDILIQLIGGAHGVLGDYHDKRAVYLLNGILDYPDTRVRIQALFEVYGYTAPSLHVNGEGSAQWEADTALLDRRIAEWRAWWASNEESCIILPGPRKTM